MVDNSKPKNTFFKQLCMAMLLLVLMFSAVVAFPGLKAVAATTTVTIGEVTIAGTVGTELNPQTIELTVENGKFDTAQFYVGKDLGDYFIKMISNNDGLSEAQLFNRKFFDTSVNNYGKYVYAYIKPLGVKIIIKETSETKVVCEVSGTPFTPSKNTAMYASFDITMFKDASGSTVSVVNTDAKWNIEATKTSQYYGGAGVTVSGIADGKVTGMAGTAIDLTFDIELYKAVFAYDMPAGTDFSNWYAGNGGASKSLTNQLPVGMSVTLVDDIKAGDTSCKLRLSGTPKYSCSNVFYPKIPAEYIVGACKQGSTENANPYWVNGNLTRTSSSQNPLFRITAASDAEEPFIVFNNNIMIYAEENYTAPSEADSTLNTVKTLRAYMTIYNSTKQHVFPRNQASEPNTTWTGEDGYLYSNTKGNLDTNAIGFLYSPCADGEHFTITNLYSRGEWDLSRADYYLSFYGKAYNVGEYPLTYFIPKTFLYGREGEEGYTTIAEGKGKLIVMKPFQLEIDDIDLEMKTGKEIPDNTFITVKTSVYSLKQLKSGLTPKTLEYKVSDSFKELGLDLEPVAVTEKTVVFKVSGTINGKGGKYNFEDCVTLSYKNFVQGSYTNVERFGEIAINPNPDARIMITGGLYGIPGQEIDYSPREDVKIYPTNKSGTKVETTYINMTQEKLVTDMTIKCYSTDGGSKWKEAKSALNDKGFQKLLKKGMTFAIADKWDSKEKAPASDAVILTFPQTEKQATKPKFKIDYVTYADATGETTGQFILTDAEGTAYTANALRSTYEIGIASGKSLNEDGYGVWPVNGGLTIAKVESNKVQKTVYYVRVAATTTTPASKEVKVSVAGQQKAPNLKIDYKKEVIKGKEGLTIRCGETYLVKNISKEDAKDSLKEISIATYLTVGERAVFDIWQSATAKKPASAIQTIEAAARAAAATSSADVVTLSKGKLALKKGYEAYDTDKQKWGGLPKIEASCVISIRKKADAKAGKENDTTYASGETMKLEVTYGVTDASKDKSGVTAAILESEKNASQSSGSGDNTGGSGGNTGESGGNTQ